MQTIETSILHVNNNSFTGPLIIGTFEKSAPEEVELGGLLKPNSE